GGILQTRTKCSAKCWSTHHPPDIRPGPVDLVAHTMQQWHTICKRYKLNCKSWPPAWYRLPVSKRPCDEKNVCNDCAKRQLNPESAATVESVDTLSWYSGGPHLFCQCFATTKPRLTIWQPDTARLLTWLTLNLKPDWDLKRGAERRLAKLERRTQRAIAELLRERLKQQKDPESLVTAVNAALIRLGWVAGRAAN
uniref:Zf-RVT domain-containing protein n=1 Tax=Macrostomum lignano TaxID=282301 RepID=A0A1I8F646_9PLAT